MHLSNTHVKSVIFLTMIALMQGCGSTQTKENHSQSLNQLQLNEENYFKVSQYIYTRQKAINKARKNKVNRTSPHKATSVVSSNSNILKVQSKNGRVEIKQKHKTILVNVDNKSKKVVVFYDDGNTKRKESTQLKRFNNFNKEIN